MSERLFELPLRTALRTPGAPALSYRGASLDYAGLATRIEAFAAAMGALGLERHGRVGIWLDKRPETVVAMFGASLAGGVFVPMNPLLRPEQVAYIARDCNVRVLVTGVERLAGLLATPDAMPDLRHVVVVGDGALPAIAGVAVHRWTDLPDASVAPRHRVIDADMTAILYTSGSTGMPKGVVLSHRNVVAGAHSVASYLGNGPEDRILSVLPLSFDYGMSQLTTAFSVGASVVLLNYLLPQDVVRTVARERITGLAAVPPLWIQLGALDWPASVGEHLRYMTNSGGAMPTATLAALRAKVPAAKVFLMYGLTEAFRSTYLDPSELDRRPTSIGKAIPNAEILVVREDGTACAPGEPGELVHRGALVSLGYWNDPARTAERFRPTPGAPAEMPLTEMAVWSGDTVRRDEEGFLYFVSRRDEMIKTSGYRVSPTEVEEVLYATGRVAEAAAFGVAHPVLGQAIVVVAHRDAGAEPDTAALIDACRARLPAYMLPTHVDWVDRPLPRNANGKIDRKALAAERTALFGGES